MASKRQLIHIANGISYMIEDIFIRKGGDISSPEDAVNSLNPFQIISYASNKMLYDLANKYSVFAIPVPYNSNYDYQGLKIALANKWSSFSIRDQNKLKQYAMNTIANTSLLGAPDGKFTDIKGILADAKNSINLSDEDLAKSSISDEAKTVVRDYKTFVQNGFRDPSMENTWANIKLNPMLINSDKYRNIWTSLLRKATRYNMFFRWSGNYGSLPIALDIQKQKDNLLAVADEAQKNIIEKDIGSVVNSLANPEDARYYSYETLGLFRS